MQYLVNWPFGTKGHYHLPSGLSSVLLDFIARKNVRNKDSFLFAHDSWNVHGKRTDYAAISALTGLSETEIDTNYREILVSMLPQILDTGKKIADANIEKSKIIKDRLGLLPSGIYTNGQFSREVSFRDDSETSSRIARQRFLSLYNDGLIYFNGDHENPEFFLRMAELMRRVPLDKLVAGMDIPGFASRQLENGYLVYVKDIPVSTIRAYATPVPLFRSGDSFSPINESDISLGTRIYEGKAVGLPISIKPLFNCYFVHDVLQETTGLRPTKVVNCNDQSLITRVNFPQAILAAYFGRDYTQKVLFNDLLVDENGKRYSFKEGNIFSLEHLTQQGPALARFLIARNTRFSGSELVFENSKTALKNLKKAALNIRSRQSAREDTRRVKSKMFNREVEDLSGFYEQIASSGEIRRALNFLSDYVLEAAKLDGNSLPLDASKALECLEDILSASWAV